MRATSARLILLLAALPWLACKPPEPVDDDDDATVDIVPPVLPTIELTSPDRASFQAAGSAVEVRGFCTAGDAPLDVLTVDDEPVNLSPEGEFQYVYPPVNGINVINLRITDTDGERATDALAVYHGTLRPLGEVLPEIAVIQASAELLDDDHPDLDDVASLVEGLLEDPGTFDGLDTVVTEDVAITPTSITVGDAAVDIVPGAGVLTTTASLGDLHATFDIAGTGWLDWLEVSGEMWADPAWTEMDMEVSASNGDVNAQVTYIDVRLDNFSFAVEWVPSWVEELLYETVQEYVQDALLETTETMVADFLEEFLQTFSMETTFGEETPVTLAIELRSLDVTADGLSMSLDGSTSASLGIEVPPGAGTLATAGAAPSLAFSTSPLTVAVDDDFVNQLLGTVWTSGMLSNFTFTGAELAAMGAGDIPPPMGPVDLVTVESGLPMALVSTDDPEWDFTMGIGEMRSTIRRTDGVELAFSSSILGGGRAFSDTDGSIKMEMDDRPAYLKMGVATLDYPEALDPGDLAALVRLTIPPMLGQANEALPGFPIPETHLGDLADVDYLNGKYLSVDDLRLAIRGDEGLWITIECGLSIQ